MSMCKLSNHYRSDPVQVQSTNLTGAAVPCTASHTISTYVSDCWAEAPVKIARKTLTIKLDRNWSSFQLANNTPPLSVTGSVIAPSARIYAKATEGVQPNLKKCGACLRGNCCLKLCEATSWINLCSNSTLIQIKPSCFRT